MLRPDESRFKTRAKDRALDRREPPLLQENQGLFNTYKSYALQFVVAQFIARQIPTPSRFGIRFNSPYTTT